MLTWEKIDVTDDGMLRAEVKREMFCVPKSLAPQLMRHFPFTFLLLHINSLHLIYNFHYYNSESIESLLQMQKG